MTTKDNFPPVAKKFNIKYMDQISYLDGFHRSGWSFAVKHLLRLHDDNAPTLLDTYVDRTFHWYKPAFLPYSSPWVGFIHHTFDTSFSAYNSTNLFLNDLFLQSLPHCRGLYVFSSDMAAKTRAALERTGFPDVPVQSLVHPTEFVQLLWSQVALQTNPTPFLVQIGAWLRDNYAVFRLNCGHPNLDIGGSVTLNKAALKGPHMDFYFKPNNFFRLLRPPVWRRDTTVRNTASSNGTSVISANGEVTILPTPSDDVICREVICRDSDYLLNKYVLGAIDLLGDYDDSVIVIPALNDDDYDTLLSRNVVFLKLWDAAAVNTIVECIVRNTPVLVNRLPAVVEMLGSSYPLYFDTLDDVPNVLTYDNILAASRYISALDKTLYTAQAFIMTIANGPVYLTL